jgi:hypothetical protein
MIRATKNRNHTMVSLAVASLLLSGCAAAAGSTGQAETASAPPPASPAATQSADQHALTQSSGPSEASKMVCGEEAKGDISSILALKEAPHTVDNWADSTYTCTYHLAEGPLVISVKESPDPAAARKYFDALHGKLEAAPIKGLANLGFPAAQTTEGSVIFLKDANTLYVDATGLPDAVGPQKVAPTDFAYQVATTILACWKEHH